MVSIVGILISIPLFAIIFIICGLGIVTILQTDNAMTYIFFIEICIYIVFMTILITKIWMEDE